MLAAALCLIWALTFIAQRTALREAPPLWIAAGRTALAALALAPWLRPLGARGWRIATGLALTNIVGFVGLQLAAATEPAPALSGKLVAMVVFAGVFGAAGGQLLFTLLLRRGEASVVTAYMFSVPITAAVLGVVLLDEPLRLPLVIGLVLVSAGVRLATVRSGTRGPGGFGRWTSHAP